MKPARRLAPRPLAPPPAQRLFHFATTPEQLVADIRAHFPELEPQLAREFPGTTLEAKSHPSQCECFCKGAFHGDRGASMRRLAVQHFGMLPRTAEEAKQLRLIKPYPQREYFSVRLLNGVTQ